MNGGRRTVVLVDDQSEFLAFMRGRLGRSAALEVVGEAESGEAALELLPRLSSDPDMVLLDVEMPGLDGFETARRLQTLAPGVRIVLMSATDDARYGRAAERMGATFVPKRSLSPEAILQLLG